MDKVYAANRQEWREWLIKNYKSVREIGLVYYKNNSGKPTVTYEESVEEALCFGWIDGVINAIDEEKYFRRFTPRKPKSIWSIINKERVARMIEEGKMTDEGLKTIEEAKRVGTWDTAYRLKDGKEQPPDFKEALDNNPAAKAFFEKLSNTDKHIYITQADIKTKAKREERIKKIVELLEKNIKPFTGKKPSYMVY